MREEIRRRDRAVAIALLLALFVAPIVVAIVAQ